MNRKLVDKIAQAVLYEGYVLYPYRPTSVKNQCRWTFGGIYPRAFVEANPGADNWFMQFECIVTDADSNIPAPEDFSPPLLLRGREGWGQVAIDTKDPHPSPPPEYQGRGPIGSIGVSVRFLHLLNRVTDPSGQRWQEAVEREANLSSMKLDDLEKALYEHVFSFPASHRMDQDGSARVSRQQEAVAGHVSVATQRKANGVFLLTVRVENRTPLDAPDVNNRDAALLRSLASTHIVINVCGGRLISQTDPPHELGQWVGECRNVGCWPVLVGENGETDTMLASPIILYDYPQIAPESPGDLFDGTEIDEILSLRILTMTDEEKRQAAATDNRVRRMLARTEALTPENLVNLHGTIRGLKALSKPNTLPEDAHV